MLTDCRFLYLHLHIKNFPSPCGRGLRGGVIVSLLALFLMLLLFPFIANAGTIQLPQTGQKTCYDTNGVVISCPGTGQDGDIQAGVPWPNPRFIDHSIADPAMQVVSDNLTGLMWTRNANLPGAYKTWQQALDYVAGMNAGAYPNFGYTDWRLPNIVELESLIDAEQSGPALPLDHPFTNVQGSYYVSSTSYAGNSTVAWVVSPGIGDVRNVSKSGNYYVWPVRTEDSGIFQLPKTGQTTSYASGDDGAIQAGVTWPNPRFIDYGDGTVSDNLTGLMWTKNSRPAGNCFFTSWQQALGYVKDMNAGIHPNFGYTDWRVPNRKESLSMVDRSRTNPALPAGHPFTNTQEYYRYSSTSYDPISSRMWALAIPDGYLNADYKGYFSPCVYSVWPVRSGASAAIRIEPTSLDFIEGNTGIQPASAQPSEYSRVVDASMAHSSTGAKVGQEVIERRETPHPYKGAGFIWEQSFNRPGASYISVHFDDFDLPPGDYVEVSSSNGSYRYTYEGKGKIVRGGKATISRFWSSHIPGDTAIVRLITTNPAGGWGFVIDKWAYGYPQQTIQNQLNLIGPEAICSSDNKEWAPCYDGTDIYNKSRPVARLLIEGTNGCTGWLIGSEGHLITNNHCISTQSQADNTDYEFMAEGATCTTDCAGWFDCPGVVEANSGTLIRSSIDLDYALIQLPSNLAPIYDYLQLRNALPAPGERIYIPQHPGGKGKQIGAIDDQTVSGDCEILSTNEPVCAGGPGDIGYTCDTEGGSSGSPVISYNDHLIVALHHCAWVPGGTCPPDPNRGVPIPDIITDLGTNLPADAIGRTFTIFNDGTADLVITAIKKRDGDAWLSFAPAAPFTIPPGGSKNVSVKINWSSVAGLSDAEQIIVESNDTDLSPFPNAVFISSQRTTYALTVSKSGGGSGTVNSVPSGIDCGADCLDSYLNGTVVTLTATADAGSTFTGWSGDTDCADGIVTMDADKACTATFNLIDATPPTGSILINNNAAWTKTTAVTLNLTCSDGVGGSGCAEMQVSNDGVFDTEPIGPVATSKSWSLTSGDGNKKVYVRYRDAAGNVSSKYSDTIYLDTAKPVVSGVSDSPDPFKHHLGEANTINYTVSDNLSGTCTVGVAYFNASNTEVRRIVKNNVSCPTAGASGTFVWDGKDKNGVLVPVGTYTYKIMARDKASNDSAIKQGTVVVE